MQLCIEKLLKFEICLKLFYNINEIQKLIKTI